MSTTAQPSSQYTFGPSGNGGGDIIHFENGLNQVVSWIDNTGTGQGALASQSLTAVSSLPATCTPGQVFQLPNGTVVFCGPAANQFSTPIPGIDMRAYNVVADVRTCIGTAALTTSNGSPSVTCTTGNFCNGTTVPCPTGQTSDVGKRFNATSGCCNNSAPVNTNTQVVPNNTTILSVQSSTQITLSANATGAGNYAFWGTDDDAAVTAADTAYQNSPTCTALIFPPTGFLVKNPHFNTAPAACEALESDGITNARVGYSSYIGWGSSNSVMYLDSSLNTNTACGTGAAQGCFFSQGAANPVHLQHIGISGGWNQKPNGGANTYVLLNLGAGSQIEDMRAVGFSAGDGSTIGLQTASFCNLLDTYFSGFGFNAFNSMGVSTVVRGGEFSNVQGICFIVNGSAGVSPINTYGLSFGTCGSVTVKVTGGPWISYGDLVYGNATNGTCVWVNGVGAQAYMTGGIVGSNGSCSTNAFLTTSGSITALQNMIVNATTNAVNAPSGAKVFDLGSNAFTGAMNLAGTGLFMSNPTSTYSNATGLLPTCSTTGLSQTACAAVAGSTNEKGTLRVTAGGVGGAFTMTLTFAGTFSGPTAAAPACTFMYSNTGTGTWTTPALLTISSAANTAVVIAGTATTSSTSTYDMAYNCIAR